MARVKKIYPPGVMKEWDVRKYIKSEQGYSVAHALQPGDPCHFIVANKTDAKSQRTVTAVTISNEEGRLTVITKHGTLAHPGVATVLAARVDRYALQEIEACQVAYNAKVREQSQSADRVRKAAKAVRVRKGDAVC